MIGQTISHYRVTGQVGSGGMGVVYEAEDLDLGRKVALKFLPPQLSRDKNALDRFLLEARTASALNHPNICTIYAVERVQAETGEQSFIAMELLEGETLDRRLSSGPLPLDRLLDWSLQMADALDAAHSKGIIHRDIKPANLFVTQRGQVKVLDFGLAKLARPEMEMETIGATQESPVAMQLTSPGATVGTISYMSPEQARGEALDTRTDLFSLGVVIYQMATGRLPFSGPTSAVVFNAILAHDPVPAIQLNASLPAKLDEVIEKALEKDRDMRYQSAADLRGDLRRLKRDTESGRKPLQSVSGSATAIPAAPPSAATAEMTAAHRLSGSSGVVSAARQNKMGTGLIAAIALLFIAAAAYGAYAFLARSHAVSFQNISVTKITDTGDAVFVAISPDGNYVLSMRRVNGLASLWLRNVPTNSNTQVQPPAEVYYSALHFSPDGNYFYFVRTDPGNAELRFLYRSALLGGAPEKLVRDVDSNVTLSPDGKQLAFVRHDTPEDGKFQLIVRSLDQGSEKVLVTGPSSQILFSLAWSPDGKIIACGMLGGPTLEELVTIDASTGERKPFYSSTERMVDGLNWLPDGSGVLGTVREQTSNFNRTQIGFVSYPQAKYSPVTRDTASYSDLSVASTARIIATIQNEPRWSLQIMPVDAPTAQPKLVTASEAQTNVAWTTDNHLIADQGNMLNLIDPASGLKTAIPGRIDAGAPWTCGQGDHIVFVEFHVSAGMQNIWRIDASGGNPRQLTNGKLDTYPVCTSDGKSVFYVDQTNDSRLARISIDGGAAQTISDLPVSNSFDVSPDGKLAAFPTLNHSGEHKEMLALVDTESGKAVKEIEFERPRFGLLHFSRDGQAVIYPARENGIDNLWQQPIDGSKGKKITEFTAEHIYDFHWSFDGKQLALVRGHTDADVVLIRDNNGN